MIPIPKRTLMGPGPSDVPQRILDALANPTIGHLDPVFLQIMDEIRGKLREVFRTKNEMTLAVSGTGSAGMETVFVNLVEPGDKVLVCVNGVFGGRMGGGGPRGGGQTSSRSRRLGGGPSNRTRWPPRSNGSNPGSSRSCTRRRQRERIS